MNLKEVGRVHSPYKKKGDAPFQGRMEDIEARIEILEEFAPALKDIEDFSHLFVLYWAHEAKRETLQNRTPYDQDPQARHGVFATRTPNRPNPINLGIVDLVRREGNVLVVRGLDAFDQSVVVDIKPYSGKVDAISQASSRRAHEKKED
ncbi:MAG: tRNA (N6-threonylcarbamoyladenosine(37)-N6)-methyltransferase TrmO [Tissierellia bacterium]|nr:tRNA (N6-threonylcarbamoyladenosine(37)-N6)-methyltransferase TrmO [Tissierellia bacterium]